MMALQLNSTAFGDGDMIPRKYTCDGPDVSPPLSWTGIPEGTRSLALICDDPDAPMGTWVHWVAFNIPPAVDHLPEGIPRQNELPAGGMQGRNDFRRVGYGGPCPPSGTHRYFFKLYALDAELDLDSKATKADVERAMQGHILAQGQLMGRYKRS